jgi:hypothetical protein
MIKRIKNKLKKHLDEVLKVKTSPHSIAMGFALGTIIVILPTFGLGIFIGLFLLLFLKRVSKVSMFVSFAFWNPIVLALLYPLEYSIGNFLLPNSPIIKFKLEIFNQLFLYTRGYLVGTFILAIFAGIFFYIFLLIISTKYQNKKIASLKEEIVQVKKILEI